MKNITVYTEQDTQLQGMEMLHPNQFHWEHGSFVLCAAKSLPSLSNFIES